MCVCVYNYVHTIVGVAGYKHANHPQIKTHNPQNFPRWLNCMCH